MREALDGNINAQVWSDFDGTAVTLARRISVHNALKYPLRLMPGYLDFLEGLRLGGAEIAGVISRRPDIRPRRFVTARSVARLGMVTYFPETKNLVLAGSERAKANHLLNQDNDKPLGLIDDKTS